MGGGVVSRVHKALLIDGAKSSLDSRASGSGVSVTGFSLGHGGAAPVGQCSEGVAFGLILILGDDGFTGRDQFSAPRSTSPMLGVGWAGRGTKVDTTRQHTSGS